jgi:hypothetical protein
MTFLDLCNKVLVRLRENTITSSQFNSNPYYRMISACVNDAKRTVEDSWQWSQLRAYDTESIVADQSIVTLFDSGDSDVYLVDTVQNAQEGYFLQWRPEDFFKSRYRDSFTNPVASNKPGYWGFAADQAGTGFKQIQLYPPSNSNYTLLIDRVKHQPELENFDDVLLVPSLPVYALATALASRERGELGGPPTSELFALSDRYLSDAIAYDSSNY